MLPWMERSRPASAATTRYSPALSLVFGGKVKSMPPVKTQSVRSTDFSPRLNNSTNSLLSCVPGGLYMISLITMSVARAGALVALRVSFLSTNHSLLPSGNAE